ncbi:MAG: GTP-binding protein [Fretibacterium sp.]|nr:GTP-binding protein [Fretibacterium sp.]
MKILIVSGFLGAGKTTFIRQLIPHLKGSVVVLENELGKVALDGDFLSDLSDPSTAAPSHSRAPIDIVEMSEGCIHCSMEADFLTAIRGVRERFSPDFLIIEPAGTAILSLILSTLTEAKEELSLAAPVTVVDAKTFSEHIETLGGFYRDQICNAPTLILTKLDELPTEEWEMVLDDLFDLNPKVDIVLPPYEDRSPEWWTGLLEPWPSPSVPMDEPTDEVRELRALPGYDRALLFK